MMSTDQSIPNLFKVRIVVDGVKEPMTPHQKAVNFLHDISANNSEQAMLKVIGMMPDLKRRGIVPNGSVTRIDIKPKNAPDFKD